MDIKYQLVPSHIHRQNVAERAIQTFKAHFLSILAGVADDFPQWRRGKSSTTPAKVERKCALNVGIALSASF